MRKNSFKLELGIWIWFEASILRSLRNILQFVQVKGEIEFFQPPSVSLYVDIQIWMKLSVAAAAAEAVVDRQNRAEGEEERQ